MSNDTLTQTSTGTPANTELKQEARQDENNSSPLIEAGRSDSEHGHVKSADKKRPVNLHSTNNGSGAQDTHEDQKPSSAASTATTAEEENNVKLLPMKKNPIYNISAIMEKLVEFPILKIRGEGKYYITMKDVIVEKHPKVKRNKQGQVIPRSYTEVLGPIESVVSRFCEDILGISRAKCLPLTTQGERHLIWVGRKKAKHIGKHLKGNGCYIVNRFPGDVFLKDKQVMGMTLRQHILERRNKCSLRCGAPKSGESDEDEIGDKDATKETYRICQHMVMSMQTDSTGCSSSECFNYSKELCKHLDVFIPEVQSFCLYNALQDFSNRLDDDLKGQLFICKPSYLYKGMGFRFFHRRSEFEEFYHMTTGKETSRHDFMVQRVVNNPYLFKGRKVDIRAFLLLMTLNHRRVVALVHPGFCRIASVEYEQSWEPGDENEKADPTTSNEMNKKLAEEHQMYMQMLVCPHLTGEERADRAKRMQESRLFADDEDRSRELSEVFKSESLLDNVKEQIKNIGKCLASGIERKVWDAYGCYQIFGLDLCVDENYKVWLLEVNSHVMSEVDLLSPTQRLVVPAVMMEALGLVFECMFKSSNGMPLRKSPYDEFKETGLLFAQNFDMVFSTLARRRTDYVQPKKPKQKDVPFYERIGVVDNMISQVAKRKQAYKDMQAQVIAERARLKKKRGQKNEEES